MVKIVCLAEISKCFLYKVAEISKCFLCKMAIFSQFILLILAKISFFCREVLVISSKENSPCISKFPNKVRWYIQGLFVVIVDLYQSAMLRYIRK